MSDTLESVLHEERTFPVPRQFAGGKPNLDSKLHEQLMRRAAADPAGYWLDMAREHLRWVREPTESLDDSKPPFFKWFSDGQLNASANCLDVHLEGPTRNKAAIVWEAEDGEVRTYTYAQLHREVCRFANALRGLGLQAGDRVAIYMPMVPEVAVAMLACARIGAPHSVVFGGFSATALSDRLKDTGAKVLITADGGYRGGKIVPLKQNSDEALAAGGHAVEHVVVLRRTGHDAPMHPGRDHDWSMLVAEESAVCEPAVVDAEHPLFVLYTSGSTGKPKGIQHGTGGYMLWAKLTSQWVFDIKPDDVYWCTADVGWITGHTYIVYGPLAAGATMVMYEGAPTYPEPDRFWDVVERHGVTIFYTAPTAIRALIRAGDEWPQKHDLSSLRLLGTVGEPINPEAWLWYHRVIGKERCPIVDTWWQTETGGIMISPLPGITPTKPGSCTQPLPGIDVAILDEEGKEITAPGQGGYLAIRKPWPSMVRTIWGDDERFVETYWSKFDRSTYVVGDTAHRDADGYCWILGRFDDVLNISGHRLGTMEVESALVAHPKVAEAAVVGRPHEVKGEALCAFVVPAKGVVGDEAMIQELREHVAKEIGPIAKPDDIRFAEGLPKTRSGKIMRRLLRSIARGEEITQDISTLEDAGTVAKLQH